MNSPSNSPRRAHDGVDNLALVAAYHADNPGLSPGAISAARHFLKWARARKVPVRDLDASTVGKFLRHRCRCSRYSPNQLRSPMYATYTRRFLRYLEETGVVAIPNDTARLGQHLETFAQKLDAAGYSKVSCTTLLSHATHFAEWVFQQRVPVTAIGDGTIDRFARHECRCGEMTKHGDRVLTSHYKNRKRGARALVRHLIDEGLIPPEAPDGASAKDQRLTGFEEWLRRERGVTSETVRRYLNEADRWLDRLGAIPKDFSAASIRSIVVDQGEERSRSSVRMTVTVLRAYLRFTIIQGECAPSLLHSVPPAVRRKLSTLPRTISEEVVQALDQLLHVDR